MLKQANIHFCLKLAELETFPGGWGGCGGYLVCLRRLCGVVAEAMWAGWLAGSSENKANSAQLEL